MNILIFSHSSGFGGAESALLNFISLLIPGHKVSAMLPEPKGELVDKLQSMGVDCGCLPFSFSLPNPANTLLHFCDPNVAALIERLRLLSYDLVVANTIVTLPGMLIAKELNIPCITYAHEYLYDEKDMEPHGCTAKFYLELVSSLSSHILCASEYVKGTFPDQEICSVLYPFTPHPLEHHSQSRDLNSEPFSLLVIGTKSRRKNTHFAITVLKALRLRGVNLHLHIIGSENSGSYQLKQQTLIRGEEKVFIHPHLFDPFSIPGKKINLICSDSEPFGLTITESLARGIPIAASKSGGPNEVLSTDFTYDIDDIDQCVRLIEKIIQQYQEYSLLAEKEYLKIVEANNFESRKAIVKSAMGLAIKHYSNSSNAHFPLNLDCFKKILEPVITPNQIIENISIATQNTPNPLSIEEINKLVSEELRSPGASVLNDIKRFDVVPFGHSEKMNDLYRHGIGLAIELLANINDSAKKNMIACIVLRLQEARTRNPNLRILCLGDGLGVDSIILASCGFEVDYVDFDQSLMSQCAELNVQTAKANNEGFLKLSVLRSPRALYDVIVSLEVIEQVQNPTEFLKFLSENLSVGGLLFISECFDGIYDRWPSHLYRNEKFASNLPVLAAPFFKLEDINTLPLGKPYLFSKTPHGFSGEDTLKFFDDPIYLSSMIGAKSKIGF